MALLSISSDAKTVKGEKMGYLTGVMYMAPFDLSGYQVCPKATDGCKLACLYKAGRGVYTNVQVARMARTRRFFEERETFLAQLVDEIAKLERKAHRNNMIPVVRLNGTSDLPWEKIAVIRDGVRYASPMEAFPNITFYDYTKILGRSKAINLANYSLTFSLAENNDRNAIKALEQGYNVAAVLNLRRNEAKPETFGGYPMIDGDATDLRFLDPQGGHVVGLFAKGPARHDTSGFVRNADEGFKIAA